MLLIELNLDLLKYIAINIEDFKSLVKFLSSSKLIKNNFDELFFIEYANYLYTKDFWHKAKERPIIKSKPLKSRYDELVRLEKFQNYIYKCRSYRWSIDEFYKFWKSYDIII